MSEERYKEINKQFELDNDFDITDLNKIEQDDYLEMKVSYLQQQKQSIIDFCERKLDYLKKINDDLTETIIIDPVKWLKKILDLLKK